VIKLHQFELSPFCDKVRRVLRHKRVPFEVVEVAPSRAPFIAAKNPAGKLPFIEHDGRVVADSSDIVRHLERTFPDPPLVPRDPRQRALSHLLEDWADESLYFYEMLLRFTLPHNAERWVPELLRSEPAFLRPVVRPVIPLMMRRTLGAQGLGRRPLAAVLEDLDRHLDSIADTLGAGTWLVADHVTLGDLGVFCQLHCIRGSVEGAERIAARPALAAWMDRVEAATN
jgi:glutathione S-transferase